MTGTTIREVPETPNAMFGTAMFRRDYDGDDDYDERGEHDTNPVAAQGYQDDFSDGYYDNAVADDDGLPAWPGGSPYENHPLTEGLADAPTVPEPAARPARKPRKSPAKPKTDTRFWTG